MTLKELGTNVFNIIDTPKDGGQSEGIKKANSAVNVFLIVLISLNVIAVVAGSFDGFLDKYGKLLFRFEVFSVAIFTVEYLLRLLTAHCKFLPKEGESYFIYYFCNYFKFIFLSLAIIDLIVVLPFWIHLFSNAASPLNDLSGSDADLRFLRLFRLVIMLRILKVFRYSKHLGVITKVLNNEKGKLLITFVFIVILILISSSGLYVLEKNSVYPGTERLMFPNIPATLWWAVATLTTVGYGDVYPMTVLGRLLAGLIAILAIGLVALPSGIISAGLIREMRKVEVINNPGELKEIISQIKEIMARIISMADKVCDERFRLGEISNGKDDFYGRYFHYFNKEGKKLFDSCIFFGLCLSLPEKDVDDYGYSLRIYKPSIKNDYKIDNKAFPYKSHDKSIFIKIDKKLFMNDDQEDELKKEIIRILENVFLKIVKEEPLN